MRKRVVLMLALALLWCAAASAQQAQPLTFVTDFTIRPGKEADYMELVKTVGAPVRDKLMAEGVVFGWGIDVPLMQVPGQATHSVWYTVAGWDGVQKVHTAMAAQIEKMRAESKAPPAKGAKPGKSFDERTAEIFDQSKTRQWVFRELDNNFTSAAPPPDLLPYSRINLITIQPGKYGEWKAAWDKYNKPVFDKLIASGVIGGVGIGTEEARSAGEFTHYVFVSAPNLGAFDKVRDAFIADRNARSAEERAAIAALFNSLTDPTMARQFMLRAIVFKVAPPKK